MLHKLLNALKKSFLSNKIPPLFFYATSLSLGICWQANMLSSAFALVGMLLLIVAIKNIYLKYLPKIVLVCLAYILGAGRAYYQEQQMLKFAQKTENADFIEGKVLSYKDKYSSSFPCEFTIKSTKIKHATTQEAQKIRGIFTWYTFYNPDLLPGDFVRIYNPRFAKNNTDIHDFFKRSLLKNNYRGSLFSYQLHARRILRPDYSLLRWIHTKKTALKEKIITKMSPQTAALFSMLFLGSQTQHGAETSLLQNQFLAAGISHYLARSGLHVALFILIINLLLSLLMIRYRVRYAILGIIVATYTALTWTSISFIRALTTAALSFVCILYDRPLHGLYLFCATYFLILIAYPFQLFSLDFQLSFLLTFGLVWLHDLKMRKFL